MPQHDQLYRYLFNQRAIRGELVTVSDTWQRMLANHDYPAPVQKLLGEVLVAASLLTASLKFSGDITVQLQGDGALKLLVINGNHQQQMRGVARVSGEIAADASLRALLGNGVMAITITPDHGERYQGVVALESDSLAQCLDDYFLQSEQLATRLFIHTGTAGDRLVAAGILLQALPGEHADADDLNHLSALTQTITREELCQLPAREVLWRLYHEEQVTLYPPQAVAFQCRCSTQRCAQALHTLHQQEIDAMLSETGEIAMHCDYCGEHYVFSRQQLADFPCTEQ